LSLNKHFNKKILVKQIIRQQEVSMTSNYVQKTYSAAGAKKERSCLQPMKCLWELWEGDRC